MESCADRICRALRIRDMKQSELSERTGIPKSAISQYCSGAFKPKQQRLFLIAKALDVDEAWLMGLDVPIDRNSRSTPANINPIPEMRKVPLLGSIACGAPILAEEHIEEYVDIPKHISADFALTCKGDSMINAAILSDDLVIVRPQQSADDGQIVVARIGDEATVKRLRRRNGQVWLMPENENYEPIDGTEAEIIGIVKAVVREY